MHREVAVPLLAGLGAFVFLAARVDLGRAEAAAPVPLGHRDFYPSEERPVGFMGDGNGYFPGATPVTEWWEGTPVEVEREQLDRWGKKMIKATYWGFADRRSKNIVWKTEMPSWANTQPIVVGDRVFTLAEPYQLVCCDARTGEVLWTVTANPLACAGVEPALAAKLRAMHDVWREGLPYFPAMTSSSTVHAIVPAEEWAKILPPLERNVLPRLLAELERLDPGTDWRTPAETTLAELKAHIATLGGEGKPKADKKRLMALHSAIEDRIHALAEPKVRMGLEWGHMLGTCMNAPISDGRYVYAAFGYGQVICVDLDGRTIWGRRFEDTSGNRTQCQSGLLAGDVYVDMHNGAESLRGLDKHTGEVLWETPTRSSRIEGGKGGYYVGSHKIVRLLDSGGETMDVVVTTLCNIIRAVDGKEVGFLPWEYDRGPSGGPSVFNSGDVVYRSACGDNMATPFAAYRLTMVSRDEVRTEKLYDLGDRSSPSYHAQVATPDYAVIQSRAANVVEARTGKVLVPGKRGGGIGGLSNILAGNVLLWAYPGNRFNTRDGMLSSWAERRADGLCTARFTTCDMSDPSAPKVLSDRNLLGGDDWPRMPAMERLAPELYALPCYAGKAYGKVTHSLHTDSAVFASGNRLFIRTTGHLYAIGDPSVPYDWNPASRPADVRAFWRKVEARFKERGDEMPGELARARDPFQREVDWFSRTRGPRCEVRPMKLEAPRLGVSRHVKPYRE